MGKPRAASTVDNASGTVMIPGFNGKTITAAVEDTVHIVVDDDIATATVQSI